MKHVAFIPLLDIDNLHVIDLLPPTGATMVVVNVIPVDGLAMHDDRQTASIVRDISSHSRNSLRLIRRS